MNAWFYIYVYGLEDDTFVSVFNNITSRKQSTEVPELVMNSLVE